MLHPTELVEAPRESRRRHGLLVTLLAVSWLGALACASPPGVMPVTSSASYVVGTPDDLRISIYPDPVIERVETVRPDGAITVDLIGDVQASGRTTDEISAEIEQRIERYKLDPKVTVSVSTAKSSAITVLGEVLRPATFPVQRRTRVIEAIGLVGGASTFASKNKVRVIRMMDGQATVIRIALGDIEKGDLATNIFLEGGDIVYLPPTVMARIGYSIQQVLFPFTQVLGVAGRATTAVLSGGAF